LPLLLQRQLIVVRSLTFSSGANVVNCNDVICNKSNVIYQERFYQEIISKLMLANKILV